ncbi:hypothetical protein [Nocardia sp. 348MFTsu5.1]|uniref:hypothetical protein n=1 Tax=Nocardia sp. 348MFTsu5.1 TaxID=1172185 RepID=UPI00037208F4|nr:hypothetical protein [Nocardia sp. 348MFTsu5.1]
MADIDPEEARGALESADRARRQMSDEVGLPATYWWGLAAGWLLLGVVVEFCPWWISMAATILFGIGHSVVASRLLSGRRRTSGVQVSREVTGAKNAMLVVGILLMLVALTIAFALILDAQDVGMPALWSALIVAVLTGIGGPEILAAVRKWTRA